MRTISSLHDGLWIFKRDFIVTFIPRNLILLIGKLKAFHSATIECQRQRSHAVDVHAIFRRLQDHISTILADLPDFAPLQLKIQRVLLSVRLG